MDQNEHKIQSVGRQIRKRKSRIGETINDQLQKKVPGGIRNDLLQGERYKTINSQINTKEDRSEVISPLVGTIINDQLPHGTWRSQKRPTPKVTILCKRFIVISSFASSFTSSFASILHSVTSHSSFLLPILPLSHISLPSSSHCFFAYILQLLDIYYPFLFHIWQVSRQTSGLLLAKKSYSGKMPQRLQLIP